MPAPAEMLASNRVGYRQHAAVPSSSNSKETSKSRVVNNRGTPVTAGMAAQGCQQTAAMSATVGILATTGAPAAAETEAIVGTPEIATPPSES
jgi:hypothetical protein